MSEGSDFQKRYEIDRQIGAGGMAQVFLARDRKHDRSVAIKTLRPELGSGIGKARFLREIMFAARLSHPHILPLFDSGESDGILFFVMPFVDGPSLRIRILEEGSIPLTEALDIARSVASALDYAHRQEVIHRDIKPENIMIHDGVAMVTDFGISKILNAEGGENLTLAGVMVGTPAYMSPEQIAGDEHLDGRTDIYSLACVLYEMLAGESPFGGPTPESALSARLVERPPDVTELVRSTPPSVARAIQKALAPDRDERFATAAEFRDALGSPHVLRVSDAAPVHSGPSIAVLPFANMSTDPENEFFSDGISDEIINALTQLKHLHVATRTSSFSFKNKNVDIGEVGAALNVATVLEGSVRRAGSRVRIAAQLINVADGYHIWSERYDRELDDVFAIQDEIATTIANRLEVALTGTNDDPIVKRPTDDVEAYQLYLKGRHLWNRRTKEGLEQSLTYFNRAIEHDPGYALAYAGLADTYLLLRSYFYYPRDEAKAHAKEAAQKALELDDQLAEAHTSLGQVYRLEMNWALEEQEYKRAIELNPKYPTAHQWYAVLLGILGRLDEALTEIRLAEELDPLSHAISTTVGLILYGCRRYEEAARQLQRAIELEPNFLSAHALLTSAYAAMGMVEEAQAELDTLVKIRGDHPYRAVHEAEILGRLGRRDEALKKLEEIGDKADDGFVGLAYASLGEADRAFAAIARALESGDWMMLATIKADPAFDPIRSDPRFEEVLRAMNLPLD